MAIPRDRINSQEVTPDDFEAIKLHFIAHHKKGERLICMKLLNGNYSIFGVLNEPKFKKFYEKFKNDDKTSIH